MINRTDTIFYENDGIKIPISYNLTSPLRFVDSKQYPGIQIADIASGTLAFIFKERLKENYAQYPKEWNEYLENSVSERSVMPDFKHLDFKKPFVQRNFIILKELVNRSVRGTSLLDGITDFIDAINKSLYNYHFRENKK